MFRGLFFVFVFACYFFGRVLQGKEVRKEGRKEGRKEDRANKVAICNALPRLCAFWVSQSGPFLRACGIF